MRFLTKIIILSFLTFFLAFFSGFSIFAESQEEKLSILQREIEQYEKEIERLKSQTVTLINQIAQFDVQIKLTTLKIAETQEKIDMLVGRIDRLEGSLTALTQAFSVRANETYKMARVSKPFLFLISAENLSQAVSRFYYLRRIQEADRDLMLRLQEAQNVYKEEKTSQEELQEELETQKKNLDSQKKAKAYLLQVTRNDEKKFQQLLAAARAEFEAIQAIIAGKGIEEEVGKISSGQRIASVIQGPSCNSSGEHLHFIVAQGSNPLNPFNYLKGGVSFENCSGSSSSCGSGDGDSFNPSGSWDWPINSPIKLSQGFGNTWAVKNTWVGRIYNFHNGIDINNEGNSEVKAVTAGTLFRGSYTGYNGCRLRYVRIDHEDSDLDTYYLHINY